MVGWMREDSCLSANWLWFPHLRIMDDCDVFGGPGAFGMVHNRVFLQTRDTTGRQDLIVLVHTQGLPSKILHWKSLTETHEPHCWPHRAPQKDITCFYYMWKVIFQNDQELIKNWMRGLSSFQNSKDYSSLVQQDRSNSHRWTGKWAVCLI